MGPDPHLIDVLDRVLDKGIVITYDIGISVAGLRAIEVKGHVIVASIETHQRMQRTLALQGQTTDALTSAVDAYLRRVEFPDGPPGVH